MHARLQHRLKVGTLRRGIEIVIHRYLLRKARLKARDDDFRLEMYQLGNEHR